MTLTQVSRWIFSRLHGQHRTRLKNISAVVWGYLSASALGVAAIGRGIAGRRKPRHTIKRVWRFLRNHRLQLDEVMQVLVRQAEAFGGMLEVADEPWYLATSFDRTLKRVCETYALRMEIEEHFRDLKSHRYGAALRYVAPSEPDRYLRLLMIRALGVRLRVAQGLAAIRRNLHLGLSSASNSRRDLSVTRIGREVLHMPLGGPPGLLKAMAP